MPGVEVSARKGSLRLRACAHYVVDGRRYRRGANRAGVARGIKQLLLLPRQLGAPGEALDAVHALGAVSGSDSCGEHVVEGPWGLGHIKAVDGAEQGELCAGANRCEDDTSSVCKAQKASWRAGRHGQSRLHLSRQPCSERRFRVNKTWSVHGASSACHTPNVHKHVVPT